MKKQFAQMAELADATDSKSVDLTVIRVRPPFWVELNSEFPFGVFLSSGSGDFASANPPEPQDGDPPSGFTDKAAGVFSLRENRRATR